MTDAPQPVERWQRTSEWLPGARAMLAIATVVAYALLRIAYGRFCEPFGLSPDDLGLGYVELLAQSALGLAILLATIGVSFAVLFAALIGVAMTIGAGISPWRRDTTPSWVVRGVALALVAISAILVLAGAAPAGAAILYAVLAFAAMPVVVAARQLRGDTSYADPITWSWLMLNVVPLVAGVALLLGGALLVHDGGAIARMAREGRSASTSLFGVRLMSWRADAATIAWTGDVAPALRSLERTCVMYLGRSDGTVFVYVPGAPRRGTYRLPATSVVVRVVPGADCVAGALRR